MFLFTRAFWTYAGNRAVNTFTQVLLGMITSNQAGATDADWLGMLTPAAFATLLSVLYSSRSWAGSAAAALPPESERRAKSKVDDGIETQNWLTNLPESTIEPGAHRVSTE
jgi:hypothetical protein